jgi:hypothetical protein
MLILGRGPALLGVFCERYPSGNASWTGQVGETKPAEKKGRRGAAACMPAASVAITSCVLSGVPRPHRLHPKGFGFPASHAGMRRSGFSSEATASCEQATPRTIVASNCRHWNTHPVGLLNRRRRAMDTSSCSVNQTPKHDLSRGKRTKACAEQTPGVARRSQATDFHAAADQELSCEREMSRPTCLLKFPSAF